MTKLVAGLALLAVACSSATTSTTPGQSDPDASSEPTPEGGSRPKAGSDGGGNIRDAGIEADGGPWRSDGGGSCSSLQPGTTMVVPTAKAGAPPSFNGGSIADGSYELVAVDVYNGLPTGGTAAAERARVQGGKLELSVVPQVGTPSLARYDLTVAGSALHMNLVCIEQGQVLDLDAPYVFEATPTSFTFAFAAQPALVFRFEKL